MRNPFFPWPGLLFEPLAKPNRVPMENELFEDRPAKKHHDPIAIQRSSLSRRWNVIKSVRAVREPIPPRSETMF